jgi:hypothetical protein
MGQALVPVPVYVPLVALSWNTALSTPVSAAYKAAVSNIARFAEARFAKLKDKIPLSAINSERDVTNVSSST